jgi:hypothetical protein
VVVAGPVGGGGGVGPVGGGAAPTWVRTVRAGSSDLVENTASSIGE